MPYERSDFRSILAVLGGTVVTWYLNNELVIGGYDMNAVLASGIVGFLGGLFLKRYAGQIFCGSFAGMSSSLVIENIYFSIFFGIIAGLIYVIWKDYLNGHGGKFGTTAFMAVCFGLIVLALVGKDYNGVVATASQAITVKWFLLVLVTSVVLTPLTWFIRRDLFQRLLTDKCADAVLGSALVGIIIGALFPEISSTYGLTLALVGFSASFAGMTAVPGVFQDYRHFAACGVFVAILFTVTVDMVPGGGGKLGTIGFTSVIITKYILEHYRERRKELCPA
ncbi:MAG: hypothetical protein JW825_05425 [Candidatus Methanofastidiosa archaeon]|nr:hypothetical protein [Candidatus Methanofastidiosa archaeon]